MSARAEAKPDHTTVELPQMTHDSVTFPEIKKGDGDQVVTLPTIDDTFLQRSPEEIDKSINEIDAALNELRSSLNAIQTMDDMPCFFKQPAWASYVGGIVAVIIGGAAIVFEAINFSTPTSPVVIAAVVLLLITVGILLSKVDRYRKALDPFQRIKKLYDVIDKIVTLQMLGLKQLHAGLGELRKSLQTLGQENEEFKVSNQKLATENNNFKLNNETLEANIDGLNAILETLRNRDTRVNKLLDDIEKNKEAFIDDCLKLSELTKKNESLSKELDTLQDKMSNALSDMKETLDELQRFQERETVLETVESEEDNLNSYSETLTQLIQNMDEAPESLQKIQTFLQTLKSNLAIHQPKPQSAEKLLLRSKHMDELATACAGHVPDGSAYGMESK